MAVTKIFPKLLLDHLGARREARSRRVINRQQTQRAKLADDLFYLRMKRQPVLNREVDRELRIRAPRVHDLSVSSEQRDCRCDVMLPGTRLKFLPRVRIEPSRATHKALFDNRAGMTCQ